MTNFERWKAGLTIDDLLVGQEEDNTVHIGLECDVCPVERWCRMNTPCLKTFLKWATREADDADE